MTKTETLRTLIFHLEAAMKSAQVQYPDREIRLAVAAYDKDGSGNLVCTFEAQPFLDDLKSIVGEES